MKVLAVGRVRVYEPDGKYQIIIESIKEDGLGELYEKLRSEGIRCKLDDRNEKIGYKVREARQIDRVPYMLIIGKNEIETKTLSVRDRDTDKTTPMVVQKFIDIVKKQICERS